MYIYIYIYMYITDYIRASPYLIFCRFVVLPCQIVGAQVTNYLLEKIRVVGQREGHCLLFVMGLFISEVSWVRDVLFSEFVSCRCRVVPCLVLRGKGNETTTSFTR
jgi:hypothetical protein